MSDSSTEGIRAEPGLHNQSTAPDLRVWLTKLASDALEMPVDPEQSLVAQGLDSLTAEELLEAIRKRGFDADYAYLLDEASVDSLCASLRRKPMDGPTPSPAELSAQPIPLTAAQSIWPQLEQQGWGAWANLSVCLSMPASLIPAAYLPGIAQSLCDANDAMRMVLLPLKPETALCGSS